MLMNSFSFLSVWHAKKIQFCVWREKSEKGRRAISFLIMTCTILTLAASKQDNAAVEVANKRSQEYLRSMLFDNRILNRGPMCYRWCSVS